MAVVSPERAEEVRRRLARDDYDSAGKPQICWGSAAERAALVAELFADAGTVLDVCVGVDDPELVAAAALLPTVAGQDIEDEGNGAVIRQRVAPDRVISTVDPDARHGHRSRRDRYDGYKLHVAVDADSDLLTAAKVTSATIHDAVVLPRLLAADPVAVAEVLGDTHYGGAQTRRELANQGIEWWHRRSRPRRPRVSSARTTS